VERRDIEALIVKAFEADSIGISAEVDEKLYVSEDGPVDESLGLKPQQPLEHLGSLAEAKGAVVVIRSLFDFDPDSIHGGQKIFHFGCLIYI
jgi:hypothetical protein